MPASTSMAVLFAAFVGLLAAVNDGANAQTYPSGPVKLIVPVPAGGVTDTMARILAQRLTEAWGQPVVVDNRPGGNYAVGAQAVARSPADGLTLLVAPDSTVTANPHLFSKLPYDPVKDLTPISVLCRITPVLVINPSLDVKSVPELIALAKSKPGSLNYGSYGIGTYAHLSMEDFKQRTGTDIVHIPYRGAAPAATALLAGDVSMLLLNLSSIEEHEKTGKVRILAVASDKRAALRPDLPTVAEAGVPGFSTTAWFALWGPPNMAPELVARIHADVAKVLESPQSREFFRTNSFERVDLTPAQFSQLIQDDLRHWGALVKAVGAKLD
ncbi:MAG: Bug family tripartite tricarboxylate transporter substrate binding protein [Xanthobacteraceae bacterium]